MSGILRTVGKVVGTVAAIAAMIPGPHQPFAAAAAVAANVALQVTATRPAARGQIQDRMFGANMPLPYLIGEAYSAGNEVCDVGWGGTVNDVDNPYRFLATVHSCCGPVEELVEVQQNFNAVAFSGTAATGYYSDYLWRDFQLGARPEADALAPNWGSCPVWGSGHKLSGMAALGLSFLWSKKGKRWEGGQIGIWGAVWKGVKAYDARLDSTYPGGSGSHRIDDESTWTYTACPALQSGVYAYGRYVNGVKVFGVDLGESVNLDHVVAWANVCDANGWTVNGQIYEPGDKWNNLKRIAEAGAGVPVLGNATIGFHWQAPRTSLATITRDDLAGDGISGGMGRGWKERVNTLVPRWRNPGKQWEYDQAPAVSDAAFLAADGEEKLDERQWDLVTNVDQVTELAIYDLWQRREAGPYVVPCKPHLRDLVPGDCVTLAEELGAHPDGAVKVVIRRKRLDLLTGIVTFTCEAESDDKHSEAIGASGGTPGALTPPSGEDLDALYGANSRKGSYILKVRDPPYPVTSDDDSITIAAFDGLVEDGREIEFPADSSLTGLDAGTWYAVFWHFSNETYSAVPAPATAELASSAYVLIEWRLTSAGGTYTPPEEPPPGYGGGGGGGGYHEP